jgi:Protein of unknown function (DUF4241)
MFEVENFYAGRTGRVTVDSSSYDLSVTGLGQLQVPSGRLGASDPFVNLDEPFVTEVPPGSYPVFVTVADVSEDLDGSHLREAYLSLVVSPGVVARVENVVPEGGTEPGEDQDGFFYGIGVDAGTVGFADADAVRTSMPEGDWYSTLFEPDGGGGWFELMDDPGHLWQGAANITLPRAAAGENVVLTHSGWGDGFYPVVKTYDARGRLLGVHIDLLVVEGDYEEVTELEPAPERPSGLLERLLGAFKRGRTER